MKLRQIGGAGKWKIVALVDVVDGEEVCQLDMDLDGFEDAPATSSWALGLRELWTRIEFTGPRSLGVNLYHQVDAANGIYEFRKGRLRVLCFEAPTGAVCVCACVFLKKSQTTPKKHVSEAVRLKTKYEEARVKGLIEIVRPILKGKENED